MRDWLEIRGWWVSRAAGSHGNADLVALRRDRDPYLIEVKSTATPFAGFGPTARYELLRAAEQAGARAWLAWWPKHGPLQWFAEIDWPSTTMTKEA